MSDEEAAQQACDGMKELLASLPLSESERAIVGLLAQRLNSEVDRHMDDMRRFHRVAPGREPIIQAAAFACCLKVCETAREYIESLTDIDIDRE
jgi:hypothetical protein